MGPRESGSKAGRSAGKERSPTRSAVPTVVRAAVTNAIAIDPRALAGFRILLGCLLVTDLLVRSRDLVAFYTDTGVLSRSVLRAQYGVVADVAFAHGLSGAAWVQALLFGLAGVVALAMVVGYRTRLATAVSLLLFVSLAARNPVLLNAGDTLVILLLVWSLFLPLGGRWSVDSLRGGIRRTPVVSVASMALLVQVVLVYIVNAVIKLRGEAWPSGRALPLVFELDHLTVRLGDTLGEFPQVLEWLGWLWLAMVTTAILLLVLAGWPRAAFVGLFAGMHLGMFLTMRLGLFPFVSIVALAPFIPPQLWDTAEDRLGPLLRRRIDAAAWRGRVDRWVPRGPRPAIPSRYRRSVSQIGHLVVAVLLVVVLLWNGASLGYLDAPQSVASTVDPEERRWDMFAPEPRTNDGWYVVPGELESGERVDAYRGGPVDWERPPELARTFASHRWFVYLLELPRPGTEPLRAAFADYLCRQWNADQEDALESVTIIYNLEPARLDGPRSVRRIELGRYDCPAA